MTLIKKQSALAWELRGCLWTRFEVVITLREDALVKRVRGYVVEVSPTDVTAVIDDARWEEPITVLLEMVLTIRRPHYHEDGPEPERHRPIVQPSRGPEPMPGQMTLGGDPPEVSKRSFIAMQRAAGLLLSQDLLDVIAALDRAARGKQSVPSLAVADAGGWSLQWTVRRLTYLESLRLCFAVSERPYAWTPGE